MSDRFGRYTILRELGRGGIGAVHLARRDGAMELCVLKRLHVEHEGNESLLKRFRREAQLSAYLDHPNIARVLDAGYEDGDFFIAFELIVGQTLSNLLARLAQNDVWVTAGASLRIALEVLDGLEHAHDRTDPEGQPLALVHRDLSPNNVMLGYSGIVKIIDFGLAAAKLGDFRTKAGQFIGTPRYMSPEQALTRPVDRRSDLYTVSVLLWEMLAGRRLVDKGKVKEMVARIANERPPPLRELAPELPVALSSVVARALEKEPSARFQTAAELAGALRAAGGIEVADRADMAELLEVYFRAEKAESQATAELGRELAQADAANPAFNEATAYGGVPSGPVPVVELKPRVRAQTLRPFPGRSAGARGDLGGFGFDSPAVRDGSAASPVGSVASPGGAVPPAVLSVPTAAVSVRSAVASVPVGAVAAPVRADPSPPARGEPAPSRVRWGSAGVVLSALGLAAAFAIASLRQEPGSSPPSPAEGPLARPTVIQKPRVEPLAEPPQAEPPQAEPPRAEPLQARELAGAPEPRRELAGAPEPRREPAPAVRREGKRAEPAQGVPRGRPFPELEVLLSRLLANPSDGALMVQLHRDIRREAARLPEPERRAIQLEIDAGLRGGDVSAIGKGLARLQSAATGP